MPRRTSKPTRHSASGSTGTESLRLAFKDFSVYDHSRSTKDSPRNNLRTISKLTRESKTLLDEQDWYEKDLSDFDDPQFSDEDNDDQRQTLQSTGKHRSKTLSLTETNSDGREYPLDLWYLIAMYIPPEDIGRFSSICRASNHVVNTVVFWIRLFRKHNRIEANKIGRILVHEHLPIIRTHVIKSLHQIYPLFQDRLNRTDVIQKDPHFLRLSRCVRIWYSKGSPTGTQRESYNYYFEFRFDHSSAKQLQLQAASPILQTTNQYMIDKDCCVLHLRCSNFVPIGPYMGMILSQITLNVSSDYRYQKIEHVVRFVETLSTSIEEIYRLSGYYRSDSMPKSLQLVQQSRYFRLNRVETRDPIKVRMFSVMFNSASLSCVCFFALFISITSFY